MAERVIGKLQEFFTQGSTRCARFSPTGAFLALGGDDKKVTLRKVGAPDPICGLHGHSSPVQSVAFCPKEETIVAGSSGGSLKVWDIAEQRMKQSYSSAHKTAVTCVNHHPYHQSFCSGSADTTIKVWDVRKKNSAYQLPGHGSQVNCLETSPDGRWIVSGGADGIVKLWDFNMGKQVEDFSKHSGGITCLKFHPQEFLLAVGSSDRTVTFWDLDSFRPVSQTATDSRGISALAFSDGGQVLCTGTAEGLKTWTWEPNECHDEIDCGWRPPQDMALSATNRSQMQCVCLPEDGSCATIYYANLSRVRPFAVRAPDRGASGPHSHKSAKERAGGKAQSPKVVPTTSTFDEIMQSPVKPSVPRKKTEGKAYSAERITKPSTTSKAYASAHSLPSEVIDLTSPDTQTRQPVRQARTHERPPPEHAPAATPGSETQAPGPRPRSYGGPSRRPTQGQPQGRQDAQLPPPHHSTPEQSKQPSGGKAYQKPPPIVPPGVTVHAPTQLGAGSGGTYNAPSPSNYSAHTHTPGLGGGNYDTSLPQQSQLSPEDFRNQMDALLNDHVKVSEFLNRRITQLKLLRQLWFEDRKSALSVGCKIAGEQPDVIADFVQEILKKREEVSLDVAISLLPMLMHLFRSDILSYNLTALNSTAQLNRAYAGVIRSTLALRSDTVDLALEERQDKCRTLRFRLYEAREAILAEQMGTRQDPEISTLAQKLLQDLPKEHSH